MRHARTVSLTLVVALLVACGSGAVPSRQAGGAPTNSGSAPSGAAINYVTSFVVPAYNPNVVSASEAPKDWNDLLDPKWRSNLGMSTATHHWARLAQVWGDERTTRFVEGLAAQQPVLAQTPEL